jgi:tetratricopeptide (TPR) repeat protein
MDRFGPGREYPLAVNSWKQVLCAAALAASATQSPAPDPITPLLDAYAGGHFLRVDEGLNRTTDPDAFVLEWQRVAPAWIGAAGPEGEPRRRRIAAALALETAGRHLGAAAARRWLIDWGAAQFARHDPDEAERVWLLAAIALNQRAYDSPPLAGGAAVEVWDFPAYALIRFSEEDRFHLARAHARELASWRAVQQAQRRSGRNAGGDILRDVARAFEALLERKTIRTEVLLRLGHTHLRLRRPAVALQHLTRIEPPADDPFLVYLTRYFTGRAREAAGDAAGAAAAFRGALEVVPRAQSASFALAALAFAGDGREEAYDVVRSAVSVASPADDPWRSYQTGDARFWPAYIARLRASLR